MKRAAVITDIHGNLPALQAGLAAIDAIGIDEIFCGGDLVGYGPHPNEVCRLIAERQIPTIYGNYDYAIARDHDLYERLAASADCDAVVFGHTHKPWIHEYGDMLFVNCGSVGKPKDGDPRAGFAVLELDDRDALKVSIERVPYDAEAVAREVAAAGLPSEYARPPKG